jgi:hypothetical protein
MELFEADLVRPRVRGHLGADDLIPSLPQPKFGELGLQA